MRPKLSPWSAGWRLEPARATKRTVHFDRWLHFHARHLYLRIKMTICHTGTENMMADGFTKPVDKTRNSETHSDTLVPYDPTCS